MKDKGLLVKIGMKYIKIELDTKPQSHHPCPFAMEIRGVDPEDKDEWCNCSEEQEQQCARDI